MIAPSVSRAARGSSPRASQSEPGVGLCSQRYRVGGTVGKGKIREDGKLQKLDVKKGDRVLFSKFSGTEVTLDGTEHLIIREDDVLGIIE